MFEAKLANSGLLKKIVESIKDLASESTFDCSETAMSLQAMDSSHVALVSLKLEVGLFDTYRCDRTINLGLSLANMSKALKCANNEDECTIQFFGEDNITFIFKNNAHRDKILVRMSNLEHDVPEIPVIDYDVLFELPATEFQKTCKDLSIFSDSLNITATKAGIVFTGKGDIGSFETTFDEDSTTLEVKEPVNVNFSIKYMKEFTKVTGISDKVRLFLCNDVPVVVEYPIEENGFLRFYLAPKIDVDENME